MKQGFFTSRQPTRSYVEYNMFSCVGKKNRKIIKGKTISTLQQYSNTLKLFLGIF